MQPNFEEKSYENYFNTELSSKSSIFFPIGQVQEGCFGFDSLALSSNPRLWRLFGFPFVFQPYFSGVDLREIADEMERYLGIVIEEVPRLKANILFQYKRAEFISISSGKEWSHWSKPYFRYDIYKEQQDLLMNIHNTFGNKVLIIYAAPAINDVNELVQAYTERKIIDSSNFKKASELNKHHRNTYIGSGTHSIAFSEQERIENFNLLKEIEILNPEYTSNNDDSNRQFIINFRKQIEHIILGNEYYSGSFKKLNTSFESLIKFPLVYSFLTMANFRLLTGIQWLIKI